MDVGQIFGDALSAVVTFIPKLVGFLLILIIGIFIAKAISKAVDAVLERIGFDKAVERGGIKSALAKSKYDASSIVSKIVYYALLLFVLQLAFGVFGPNPVSELIQGVISFLPRLFVAILIIVVAAAIAKAVKDLISNTLGGLSYGNVLATIASVFILGLGIIAALNQIGVATTVTTPVLITVLATIGGILVVGVGGGLIRPMQQRWEGWLTGAERESGAIREQVHQAPSPREQAEQARDRHSSSGGGAGAASSRREGASRSDSVSTSRSDSAGAGRSDSDNAGRAGSAGAHRPDSPPPGGSQRRDSGEPDDERTQTIETRPSGDLYRK